MCDCAARLDALEQRIGALEAKKKPVKQGADWLAELKADPLFKYIDFAAEERKIAIWKLKPENVNRQITKRFWLNWLAKVDTAVPLPRASLPRLETKRTIEDVLPLRKEYCPAPPPEVLALLGRVGRKM